jgi:hypothetical protein
VVTHTGTQEVSNNVVGGNDYILLDLPLNAGLQDMINNAATITVTTTGVTPPPIPAGTTVIDSFITLDGRLALQLSNLIPTPNASNVSLTAGTVFVFTSSIATTSDFTITTPPVVGSIDGCAGNPFPSFTSPFSTLVTVNCGQVVNQGDILQFENPDGTIVTATVAQDSLSDLSAWQNGIFIEALTHREHQKLLYNNCYSFGNGVESNRIRDLFNAVTIDKGVKASTTLAEQYKEERRKSGLIFSGIYNSMSGVNRLNQFIMAENITKDLNPTYGSIQKLHQRDTDLVTLCEDKVLKILSHKDALYNADDTKNITATQNVLGNSIPFIGEYGISKNPESFASEAFRAYFTDKERGAVLRLSRDGLTPISDVGMKDWFADNLTSFDFNLGINDKIIGSYDRRRSLYNITHRKETNDHWLKGTTLSFSEGAGGWVSFKSFDAEIAISLNNEYYTGLLGKLWKHHDNTVDRNSFHDWTYDNSNEFTAVNRGIINSRSYITLLFNDLPNVIKSFNTLNYEGSQSKVHQNLSDDPDGIWVEKHRNNWPEVGWYVNSITTDQQVGTIPGKIGQYAWDPEQGEYEGEFINKEGKWFNYIIGKETIWTNGKSTGISPPLGSGNLDTQEFAVQGISTAGNMLACGCPDPTACNYQSWATCDDGSCYPCN